MKAEQVEPTKQPVLYAATDGACLDNGKRHAKGGYAVIYEGRPDLSLAEPLFPTSEHPVTNNRCEIMGLIRALQVAPPGVPVHVYSDSMLLVNTVTKWMNGWKRSGWKKKDGGKVMNEDLIRCLDDLRKERIVTLEHVRAHTNKKDRISLLNDRADIWAKRAANTGRSQIISE